MFKTLKFEVVFNSGKNAGRLYQGDYSFEKGMTGIFGDNEAGKSLRLEMMRFALFGSKALRGSVSDFKKLSVETTIIVKGKQYAIHRGAKDATLLIGDRPVAKGTTPVNAAITKLLGYGMEVFNIANASLQDEVQALTNMKPTERKKMVDRVVGLDALDKLSKLYADDASHKRAGLSALEGLVTTVTLPRMPADYEPTVGLQDAIARTEKLLEEKRNIDAKLAALKCDEPAAPTMSVDASQYQELVNQNALRKAAFATIASKNAELTKMGEPQLALAHIEMATNLQMYKDYVASDAPEKWVEWNRKFKEEEDLVKPKHALGFYVATKALIEWQSEVDRIERLKCDSTVNCPHCTKDFSLQQTRLDEMSSAAERDFVAKVVDCFEEDKARAKEAFRTMASPDCTKAINQWGTYNSVLERNAHITKPDSAYRGTRAEVEDMIRAVARYEEQKKIYDDKSKELKELKEQYEKMTDHSATIALIDSSRAAAAAYEAAATKWREYSTYRAETESILASFGNLESELTDLRAKAAASAVFEKEEVKYRAELAQQERVLSEIAAIKGELEQIEKTREALASLKPKIKTFLMPSLNSVASNLLSQMTNGVRNLVYIDEEFDILIDGQRVETLSGSGKAVVNLAIRIALGTVLTNKVFSVFMADEVDAAMRGDRASYTAACLKKLTEVVDQILIISHKDLEVDHRILV